MQCLSTRRIRRLSIGVGIMVLALFPLFLYGTSQPTAAQCGSSASSCKNCHEVQGNDPVGTKGEWHVTHAFGDFCEFCHAGNVEAKTKEEAHVGLVHPMLDIKASCQSCHPQDYNDKAKVYATACGLCSRFCPTGALELTSAANEFTLRFTPRLCIDCGICAQACPEKAITLGETLPTSVLNAGADQQLATGPLQRCAQCGAFTAIRSGDQATIYCYACRPTATERPSANTVRRNLFDRLAGS